MKLRITVDGKAYEVDVEILQHDVQQHVAPAMRPATTRTADGSTAAAAPPLSAPPPTARSGPVDESKVFRSPISGVVVRIPVEVGQAVKTNDVLMVLEAMKMETVITSQADGKIRKITADVGDSVQVKQVLVEFE